MLSYYSHVDQTKIDFTK
nr:unnamed protein product [Callosobruchus chinensis]